MYTCTALQLQAWSPTGGFLRGREVTCLHVCGKLCGSYFQVDGSLHSMRLSLSWYPYVVGVAGAFGCIGVAGAFGFFEAPTCL